VYCTPLSTTQTLEAPGVHLGLGEHARLAAGAPKPPPNGDAMADSEIRRTVQSPHSQQKVDGGGSEITLSAEAKWLGYNLRSGRRGAVYEHGQGVWEGCAPTSLAGSPDVSPGVPLGAGVELEAPFSFSFRVNTPVSPSCTQSSKSSSSSVQASSLLLPSFVSSASAAAAAAAPTVTSPGSGCTCNTIQSGFQLCFS
jgi:hypothetical protein